MKTILAMVTVSLLLADAALARPQNQRHEVAPDRPYVDRIELVIPSPQKSAPDTSWIATWTFDGPGGLCDESGWTTGDRRNLYQHYGGGGEIYWSVDDSYSGVGVVQGSAAVLGDHDLCWVYPDGYDNNWYQGMRIGYVGASFLSFGYLVDSESDFDFLQVEIDSACSSFDRVFDLSFESRHTRSANLRQLLWTVSGLDTLGVVDSLLLGDHGAPADTHCVYISFVSDGGFAPSDGLQTSTLGVAAVIDNLVLEGDWPLSETFDGIPNLRITYRSMYDDRSFGNWARLYKYVTDNSLCTENTNCAWLWTDDQTPTYAYNPDMAFGPSGYVVRNWLDNFILSPWVSMVDTPDDIGTVLSMRRFPGNFFSTSRFVMGWSIRSKKKIANTDTQTVGDSIECVSDWGHAFQHNSLSLFEWITSYWLIDDDIPYPDGTHFQLRIKAEDWQFIAGTSPPTPHNPGPGPYVDRVRIGRLQLDGPEIDWGIDARFQAQDAFPTQLLAGAAGEHHEPTTDRFGHTAFSRGGDLAINASSPRLITGDSITVDVTDARGAGGVTSVDWFGSIVSGPHVGKAPPPYSVAPNGFFQVGAEMCRAPNGTIIADRWFVDLDDEYFRGGDVLLYYWQATDALAGVGSLPPGISGTPADLSEAESLTGGLFEVSFLPTINWDPAYVARISADPNGKLDPTQQELDNSEQATCILYSQMVNTDRRSGDGNRTSFQYTLDQLGYRGFYDVYDLQGLGNTNNQLGGRATVEQAEGYALIIHDAGNSEPGAPILPDGIDIDAEKVDQLSWYQQYLAAGSSSEAGSASLWMIASNAVQEKPLDYGFMSTTYIWDGSQTLNPTVEGEPVSYLFASGLVQDFSSDALQLDNGCPTIRDYDHLGVTASGTVVHRYHDGTTVGDGAVVMASDSMTATNTILMSFAWADIRDVGGIPIDPSADRQLAQKVLDGVLPNGCVGVPTDVPDDDDDLGAVPLVSALHQNSPNPFNPTTRVAFDVARQGRVALRIYDVTGRLVRVLVDEVRPPGYGQSVVWDGRDAAGRRLASGIYFYRLETADLRATRKLVVLK